MSSRSSVVRVLTRFSGVMGSFPVRDSVFSLSYARVIFNHFIFIYWLLISFQFIIPASWIFAVVMESPGLLSSDYNKPLGICIMDFPDEWMGKAFSVVWFLVFGGFPIPLMLALYSKVVYKLWFKGNAQSGLSHQQQV